MKERLIKTLMCSTVLASALAATSPALAQDQESDDSDVIVVTGSRLNQANIESTSPVVTVDSELFDIRGTVDTVDLINTLPSAFAAQTTAFANGASGTSNVDLRGLGAVRTLVLVDGKRLSPGGPLAGFSADLNLIPSQLVERVEIVTGGASAVYGSDAIAGVANFILKKDFEGIEIDGLFGFNQSSNGSELFRDALLAVNEDPVQGSVTDNDTYDISAVFGSSLDNGRGNVTGYFRYLRNDGIQQGDRDFARCATFPIGATGLTCLGSNQGPFPTTFVVSAERELDAAGNALPPIPLFDAAGNPIVTNGVQQTFIRNVPISGPFAGSSQLMSNGVLAFDAAGNPVANPVTSVNASLGADDTISAGFNNPFNFNPFNPIRRSVERLNAGFSGYYDVTDNITGYIDVGFTQSTSPQVIAPSAAFGSTINRLNCDNPLLSADLLATTCGTLDPATGFFSRDTDGDGFVQTQIRRRFVEGGPRTDTRTRTNFRVVGGFKGTFAEQWDWDVFGQHAITQLQRLQTNQVTLSALQQSLDIVTDPATGQPACRSAIGPNPANPNCVPFTSAFQNGAPSAASLPAFVDTPTITVGSSEQTVFGGTVSTDLGNYGFKSPFAAEGVSFLLGGEYRRDALIEQADGIAAAGNLVGSGGATTPSNASTEVYEVFFETAIPLVSDQPFVEQLNLTGAFRYSDYSSTNNLNSSVGGEFSPTTFAVGASWVPVDDLRIRAQFQRAIRAPNVNELFTPQNSGLASLADPCSGATPKATQAACANTGLSAALFGNVPDDSGQLNLLTGGNPILTPERANTLTIGAVYQPRQVEGLTLSVDYFDIEINDAISTIPATTTLSTCLSSGDPQFCSLIQRGPDGSLTFFPREQAFITAINQNIARFGTKGFDLQAAYSYDIGSFGSLSASYNATYLLELTQQSLPTTPVFDCTGFFAEDCGNPNFEYRHNLTTAWDTPWGVRANVLWRYFSSVDQVESVANASGESGAITTTAQAGDNNLADTLNSESYFDVALFWDATEKLTLRAGVNNIFDNDPPVVTTFGINGVNNEANTIAGVYTAEGRFIFFGANIRF